MKYASEEFGRLLNACVRAAASIKGMSVDETDDELGHAVNTLGSQLKRYRAGLLPQEDRAIEVFTIFGVEQALLSRRWATRFLKAARYGADEQVLLEKLFGKATVDPALRPAPSGSNLPPHTVIRYIVRDAPFTAVLNGLAQQTPLVILLGTGGVGKSTLAIEAGRACLGMHQQSPTTPVVEARFDWVVWISDKWRPGVTTLGIVLDDIVYTLGYPGYAQLPLAEKLNAVDRLMRRRSLLIIIDNFETITDDDLMDWLLSIPYPSKGLVTTRDYRKAFQQGGYLVELGGMNDQEAQIFIRLWEQQHFVHTPLSPDACRAILDVASGNPQLIKHILGVYRRTGRPIDALIASHTTMAEALESLFQTSWETLDWEGKQVLLIMTLFAGTMSSHALETVMERNQDTIGAAITSLVELALIDVQYGSDMEHGQESRYAVHPLVLQFVTAKHNKAKSDANTHERDAEAQSAKRTRHTPPGSQVEHDVQDSVELLATLTRARERWLAWAVARASDAGFVPKDVRSLQRVDADAQTLADAAAWALEHGHLRETIALVHGLEYFYYVRGWWDRKLKLHDLYLQAAHLLGDPGEQLRALTMHIQMLSRTDAPERATPFLEQLHQLVPTMVLDGNATFHVYHAEGLYRLAQNQLDAAVAAWDLILSRASALDIVDHMVLGAQRWLGIALERQGRIDTAQAMYQASLDQARQYGYLRDVARNQLLLAQIDLRQGNATSAAQRLAECQQHTQETDTEQQAHLHVAQARLLYQQGENTAAHQTLQHAIGLFEQMGLLQEASARRAEHDAMVEQHF